MGINAIQDLSLSRNYLYNASAKLQQELDDCLAAGDDWRAKNRASDLLELKNDMERTITLFGDLYRKALKAG